MVSSLLTLHLEKVSSRMGGPTAGWVDQQQVAFYHFQYILCILEVLSPMVREGSF